MSTAFSLETIPNRLDYTAAQRRLYAFWEDGGYFHADPDAGGEPYAIVIPPPNVTGALHLGHALNNTLQDIVIRFRRMQGYNTLWLPGTDHAGIATQAVVEKRLLEEEGKTRHDLGRERLVERIWSWKEQYETRILSQLKQLGCSCDWQRTRFTLDEVCARAVRQTFFDLFGKRLIYRGKRLVNWDTYLQTAVSDDEVFHETIQGHFWHFRYPFVDPRPGEPTHVTLATTRPETMLGDTAVAVHPDPAAALDKAEAELEKKLADAPAREKEAAEAQLEEIRRRRTALPLLVQLRDMALAGRKLMLPLVEREIPLIADPWAKPELGSGCVKITPAHDANDYEVGLRAKLPMINILNPDGTLNANAGPYAGQTIAEARENVVADMDRRGLLVEVEDREIELAHSDRSKTPIEPYLADQWFVKMDDLAQSAMDAVTDGRVKIIPPRYAKGYLDWLGEKRDWPVSRQLWWGHRIPVWSKGVRDQETGDILRKQVRSRVGDTTDGVAVQVIGQSSGPGVEVQKTESGTRATVSKPEFFVHVCLDDDNRNQVNELEGLGFVRVEDVLDTWFSSALWPHSTLGWPEQTPELAFYYPTSTLITSRDIITLWVARMVLTGLNNMGEVPFREVYIHPKILDGYGETMSKSKGNGVDPLDVIEKFGADALRYGLAHLTTQSQDVRMPVQFECPHCRALIEQTKENRELPRVRCKQCRKDFSTQWATKQEDKELPRGAVVSERFELARNFCNKLWNASRFALLNLGGYTPGPVADEDLAVEDRWILSRLATVAREVTECLKGYRYSDAARALYDFAWDEFCSFYVEMIKSRLQCDRSRPCAQRVLAHTLDNLLRLLHPMIPFITEEVWQLLGRAAPTRGLERPQPAAESIMIAPWPACDAERRDEAIEARFGRFQEVLRAIREIRSRQNIPMRETIRFSVRCDRETAELIEPMAAYFSSMAVAECDAFGPEVQPPPTCAKVDLSGIEVFVDLKGLIDVEAERGRLHKRIEHLEKQIQGKKKQLANKSFVQRAPAQVVQGVRDSLAELDSRLASTRRALANLERAV